MQAYFNTKKDYFEENSTKKFHVGVKQILLNWEIYCDDHSSLSVKQIVRDFHVNGRRFRDSKDAYS